MKITTNFLIKEMGSKARWFESNSGVERSDQLEQILARSLVYNGDTIFLEVKTGSEDHPGVVEAEGDNIGGTDILEEIFHNPFGKEFALHIIDQLSRHD
ncbi:MAG: hypothetical protein HN846_00305 [Candidatus Pacebacteria bacterium]|jgi:hypothetical protein|nr:hypothetical protein [Candidatus Paceibacterota bacterium]MBT3512064.1 hypothetical protein [Candidatus Paceibacterota bacterium]MBT4004821.1 hypothetical protein [Candidatus Paceibacterota bacterium]MBT4358472.1 hypothetical protein [Candidatus Paceibacterota bacterium]MBT4681256.1 hypothetical protein [Candidatus Paceibacterota bacterium]